MGGKEEIKVESRRTNLSTCQRNFQTKSRSFIGKFSKCFYIKKKCRQIRIDWDLFVNDVKKFMKQRFFRFD